MWASEHSLGGVALILYRAHYALDMTGLQGLYGNQAVFSGQPGKSKTLPNDITASPSKSPSTDCQTITLDEAAKQLGISRSQAYVAAERGEIPTIRIGSRWLVLKGKFKKMLAGEGG